MSDSEANPGRPEAQAIGRLLDLMARLRAPGGCPWDREQTPATLKPQMLEECYEVLEAIDSGSAAHLAEELGDLLLHIVFQAQIAREAGDFTFADVANGIADKLVRRHPHVFGSEKIADTAGIVALWDELKKKEKPERASVLDGVPRTLPALLRAEALQKKARKVGFDWPEVRGALGKVREEIDEVAAEIGSGPVAADGKVGEEIGDLLFSIVNLARQLGLESETLLTSANDKFARRFRAVEQRLKAEGREPKECTLAELDAAWNEVKAGEGTH
jgi:MazG family protein